MNDPNHHQWVLDALDQYECRLLRYAQRLLDGCSIGTSSDEARDVVQFVFLRLCDQSESDLNDRLPQWLYTVCRNRAVDVLRCRERPPWCSVGWDKAAPADDGPPSLSNGKSSNGKSVGRRDEPSLVPPYEDDPATIAEQADLHALLRTLIDDLPTNQREALDLWADGFSYIQISAITKHSAGHIRVLVHRGLKALREHPRVKLLTDDEPTLARSASEGK